MREGLRCHQRDGSERRHIAIRRVEEEQEPESDGWRPAAIFYIRIVKRIVLYLGLFDLKTSSTSD